MTQALLDGILYGGVYALIGVGLTLIFGVMGIINFAHGDFLMIGLYTVFFSVSIFGLAAYSSALVVVPIIAALGLVTFWTVVRPSLNAKDDHAQLLTTFGASLILQNIALAWFTPRSRATQVGGLGATYLSIGSASVSLAQLLAFFVSVLVIGFTWVLLQRTYAGWLIRAAAEDRQAAALCGINVIRVYAAAFTLGIATLGVTAVILTPFYYVTPQVGIFFTLIAFVVIAIGGMGSFGGAIIGGLVVGLAQSFGAYLLPGSYSRVVMFSAFVLILVFRPRGLFGVGKV